MGYQTIRRVDSLTVRKTLGFPPIELAPHRIVGMKREKILKGAATCRKKKRVRTPRFAEYIPKTCEKKNGHVYNVWKPIRTDDEFVRSRAYATRVKRACFRNS